MIRTFFQNHRQEILIVACAMLISIFFNFYKSTEVPACLNSDEVAFGYNTYSILQTGKDEFGKTFPIRFQSFNDFKLPLYTYLSMPFVAIFGLNDFSVRVLNKVIAVLLIPSIYVLALHMFKKKKIAYVSTFLTACTPWIYIISRHAHEGGLLIFFLVWAMFFVIKYQEKSKVVYLLYSNILLILASHSYHLGRFFVVLFLLYQVAIILPLVWGKVRQNGRFLIQWAGVSLVLIVGSLGIDALYGAPRVNNLFLFQDNGFKLVLDEKLREDGNYILHNYITSGITDITARYFEQVTPEFFITSGDKNPRFGFEGIGLMTPVEYIFVFIGLYFLFKSKHKYRGLLAFLLIMSPVANALTWQDRSLIRTYFMIVPIALIASYGMFLFVQSFIKHRVLVISGMVLVYGFFLILSWDMYLTHYYKRALVARSWQCGYKELAEYVRNTYDTTDEFFITLKHGQPYIYLLFYNQVNPETFQRTLQLTKPDVYGFTQVKAFDKYRFYMSGPFNKPGTTYIGYPDDFDSSIDKTKVKEIKFRDEVMFWIVEN